MSTEHGAVLGTYDRRFVIRYRDEREEESRRISVMDNPCFHIMKTLRIELFWVKKLIQNMMDTSNQNR